jgi:DNA-binding GntR family transcriptional regulator
MHKFYDKVRPLTPTKPLWLRVLEFLKDAIVKGDIQPGEKLNEVRIAAKLGVSRSPVREAIRVLESEKFVETIDRRGTFVKPLSAKDIEEIQTVLKFLQVAAIELAVKNMDSDRKKELTAMIAQMEERKHTTDIEELKCMSRQFHSFIVQASDNDLLIRINESLLIQQERVRLWGASTEPEDISAIIDEHLAISRAFLRGDAEGSARLMEEHVYKARMRFMKALSKLEQGKAGMPRA